MQQMQAVHFVETRRELRAPPGLSGVDWNAEVLEALEHYISMDADIIQCRNSVTAAQVIPSFHSIQTLEEKERPAAIQRALEAIAFSFCTPSHLVRLVSLCWMGLPLPPHG